MTNGVCPSSIRTGTVSLSLSRVPSVLSSELHVSGRLRLVLIAPKTQVAPVMAKKTPQNQNLAVPDVSSSGIRCSYKNQYDTPMRDSTTSPMVISTVKR